MAERQQKAAQKPFVLITGAAGDIGATLTRALRDKYQIIAVDRFLSDEADFSYKFDLTSTESVQLALREVADKHGKHLAAVVHLAAYFDFTGEHSPLYDKVNVDGTRNLLKALESFDVDRFIYSSTMLVHKPGVPGKRISEDSPLGPRWIYPLSKADTERVIRDHAGDMPYTLLRLAGLYDEHKCVPTLSHQIARIYEKNMKSHLYAGDTGVGQACIHKEDMIEAFRLTIDKRKELPKENEILVGEGRADTYEALQNRLGELIHGEEEWDTLSVPKPVAKTGAWVEEQTEPLIPDDFKSEKPFIRPFMIDLANDHYELDISRAKKQLGWEPKHSLIDELEKLVANLKKDPHGWYKANGIKPPDWLAEADELGKNPGELRTQHQKQFIREHNQNLWAHFVNMTLGLWLLSSPPLLGYTDSGMAYSDWISGALLLVFAGVSLSWKMSWARWVCAAIGFWVLFAPLVFATESAAAYLNSTLVGILIISFSAVVRPAPGVSPVAAGTGPTTPPGWDNNPSSWLQRGPVIALALVGFFLSRYMAAYQLGHIDGLWDPFFTGAGAGVPDLTGSEAVTTSDVSESFPVSDAGVGAIVYAAEILLGLMGSTQRWRTQPWVVASFGFLIVPLGVVSITFIIIQPIIIGTWCALCLIAAGVMLVQIAYAFNEFVATGQFLMRRHKAGAPVLKIFFIGDTDEGKSEPAGENFQRSPLCIFRDALVTGVNVPWNLALCVVIGLWLMSTRVGLGHEGAMANWDHLIGALIITLAVIAMAESARMVRLLMVPLVAVLFITPFVYDVGTLSTVVTLVAAVTVIALAVRRGPITGHYGSWNRCLV
ncbi:NAD-dependent epimerase/dehydratase family protein [Marinimicrobium sp. ABcell2]|uniref:NAD-dependent epimerase/dehydratase family protein n=1 Tax=Marinimicrobium sp. ABcell2 TaxID=3069751 RepID=UPI0027B56535|nr:NAD-dependent epimerase/dehydratase family protein [Marinimicrobium sp. ABcell2]MDQ2076606.1 NAD-dependent epimerase/dehydratase family protein [Marinimicrobium sp. ABcell2]